MPALLTAFTLCYPLAVHLSIYFGHVIWAAYFLATLLALPLVVDLLRGKRPSVRSALFALGSSAVFVVADYQPSIVLKLYPLLIFGLGFTLFASSLVAGRTPLISRFAMLMTGDLSDVVLRYGRHATIAWSLFLLVMIVVSAALSLFASLEAWSWFSNVFSYVMVVLMFTVEFAVRRRVLRDHVNYSFIQFLCNLKAIDYRQLLRASCCADDADE